MLDTVDPIAVLTRFSPRTQLDTTGPVPVIVDSFWTAGQRQGHALHEVSYRACFKGELPGFFIERLTQPGDTVHDPFLGRGTTALQATLMRRAVAGSDINPLSLMLARPRLDPPTLDQVQARLAQIDWNAAPPAGHGADAALLTFYHPETLARLDALKAHLIQRDLDPVDDWIRMVALNRLTGHSPGFFSVYSLPPNQAVSVQAQARINARLDQTPPPRDVPGLILKKSRSLLRQGMPPPLTASPRLAVASAESTPHLADGSVDLVVTSPPFLDVVQYADDNWLRAWFADIDVDGVDIAMHRKPEDWTAFIARIFSELARVVRPGGHVAFEVGEVRNGQVRLEEQVLSALPESFEPLAVLINAQSFTKTANIWGVGNNARGVNTNRIVLARRH